MCRCGVQPRQAWESAPADAPQERLAGAHQRRASGRLRPLQLVSSIVPTIVQTRMKGATEPATMAKLIYRQVSVTPTGLRRRLHGVP
jgi:hypothetical protein